MQHEIEVLSPELTADIEVAAEASLLVEDDELDLLESRQELVFDFSYDPGDLCIRPRSLDCTNNRNRVARIADRGQPDDAQFFWREIERR